jgi:hypothetical protein
LVVPLVVCFLQYGGVELVLQGLLRHLLRSQQRPGGSAGQLTGRDRGRGTAGRSGNSSSSFDAKILALNVLTNCVEVDAESRLRLGSLAVVLNQAEDAVVVSRLVKREDYDGDGMGGGVVVKEEEGARSADETLTPVLESLVQYLLVQIQPFADQLNQVRLPASIPTCIVKSVGLPWLFLRSTHLLV